MYEILSVQCQDTSTLVDTFKAAVVFYVKALYNDFLTFIQHQFEDLHVCIQLQQKSSESIILSLAKVFNSKLPQRPHINSV